MGRRKKRKILDNRGMTLVELVAAFALTAIFAVGSCMILALAMRGYNQLQETKRMIVVSDLVMDKITRELGNAQLPTDGTYGNGLTVLEDSVGYLIGDGRMAVMTAEDGQLVIRYSAMESEDGTETEQVLGKAVYDGLTIGALTFDQPEGYPASVVQVRLCLVGNGSYTATRYARCYNLSGLDAEQPGASVLPDGH